MSKRIERNIRLYPSDLTPNVTSDFVALKRPQHFLLGMKVIADYAIVEAHLLMLVTGLANTDPVTAGAMFGAIHNSSVQRDVIEALAQEVADGVTLTRLKRALKIVELAGGARNAFAHKVWCLDDQLLEDVVLVDPGRAWRVSHAVARHGGPGQISMAAYNAVVSEMRAKLMLFNVEELAQAEKDCANAATALQLLGAMQSGPEEANAKYLRKFEQICGWYSV